jgi:hypothetical protein
VTIMESFQSSGGTGAWSCADNSNSTWNFVTESDATFKFFFDLDGGLHGLDCFSMMTWWEIVYHFPQRLGYGAFCDLFKRRLN